MGLLHREQEFAEYFLSHLLTRTARVEADLVDQLFNSSEMRLARALLLLANYGGDLGTEPVPIKVNQETLAALIGTTRSRVNLFMNKFRKLGLIDYNGKLEVRKALLNYVLNERPHIRPTREKFCADGRRLARPDARHRRPGSSFFELPRGRSQERPASIRQPRRALPPATRQRLLPYPIELNGRMPRVGLTTSVRLSSAKVLEHIDPECRREVRIDPLGVDLVDEF